MNPKPANKPTASRKKPARRVSKRGRINEGRPTKATPERIQGILESIARGLTEEQACAVHDVSDRQWREWKSNDAVSSVAFARAKGEFIQQRLAMKDACDAKGGDWKRFIFELKCSPGLREQFADVDKQPLVLNAQQNNYTVSVERAAEIDAQRKRCRAMIEDK